jgi:hypothetical protein
LEEIGIWLRVLIAGVISMVVGFIISIVVMIYGLKGFFRAFLSMVGLGISIAGLYLAIKGFTVYMAARIPRS